MKYARPSDYAHGAVAAAGGPGLLWAMEKMHPSGVGKGGFAQAARLAGFIGAAGGFLYFYQRSIRTYLDSARIPPQHGVIGCRFGRAQTLESEIWSWDPR